jgi:monoamine oxidase
MGDKKIYDSIIIGAGISGLAATHCLRDFNILCLEADDTYGGRIYTENITLFDEQLKIDMGAAWIHIDHQLPIKPKSRNPLTKFLRAMGYSKEDLSYDNQNLIVYHNGKFIEPEVVLKLTEEAFNLLKNYSNPNASIDEALKDWIGNDPLKNHVVYVQFEGPETAASRKKISARDFVETYSKNSGILLKQGMSGITDIYYETVKDKIKFNQFIKKISYNKFDDVIEVTNSAGEVFYTKNLVCSIPVGVLKSGAVEIDEFLFPKHKKAALDKIEMGLMNKIIVPIKREFFEKNNIKENSHLHTYIDKTNTAENDSFFYVLRPMNYQCAICFVGGDEAWAMEKFDADYHYQHALKGLKSAFGDDIMNYIDPNFTITQWGKEKFAKGSYSYVLPGGEDAREFFGKPIRKGKCSMQYIGEHVEASYLGEYYDTHVTGALLSGIEAGDRLCKSIIRAKKENDFGR